MLASVHPDVPSLSAQDDLSQDHKAWRTPIFHPDLGLTTLLVPNRPGLQKERRSFRQKPNGLLVPHKQDIILGGLQVGAPTPRLFSLVRQAPLQAPVPVFLTCSCLVLTHGHPGDMGSQP